jgi:citrate lyase beta subunit
MVFLDLEDSVSPLEKEAAHQVVNAIKTQDWGDRSCASASMRGTPSGRCST